MSVIITICHPLIFPNSINSNKLLPNHKSTLTSLKLSFFRNPRTTNLAVFASGGEFNGGGEVRKDLKKDRRPEFNLRWRDLLNPDPENILAVGLTGLLTWASVQVLWQVLFISIAIVLAALKYSFIAALLLFILITLL